MMGAASLESETMSVSTPTHFVRQTSDARCARDLLPPDMIELALHRLWLLCLATAGLASLSLAASFVVPLMIDGVLRPFHLLGDSPDLIMLLVSLVIARLVRRRTFAPRTTILVGLAHEVVVAVWLCVTECVPLVRHDFQPVAYFSFTMAWVLFFPAIMPVRQRALIFTTCLTAAVPILGRLLVQAAGWVQLPEASLYFLVIFMSSTAAMGIIVARVVYRLGCTISAAREMGSYTLQENLGAGGMGEVWRASHRMLARPAAVKFIKPEVLSDLHEEDLQKLHQRFEHEVQATAMLRSPHTVGIYDYGLSPEGTFYYVMELLDGVDMETLVERFGPLESSRVRFLLEQACHSLAEAHNRHLIHRDIKPANLFVCRHGDDFDFVKVLDFGLVKHRAARDDQLTLTREGTITGTPAYMPPEAAKGLELDHRSDIYSIGCVAYWLLTGNLVFSGSSPIAVLADHLGTEPVPPSQRSELEIPPALDELVLACLAKDPEQRPASARELSRRLAAAVPENGWSQDRARDWWTVHGMGAQTHAG
jgi:serine/threonine-protein kinase